MRKVSMSSSNVQAQLGLCAAALVGTAAVGTTAEAALVTTFQNTVIPVPATLSGIYINLENGTTGPSSALAGWDFNPYQTASGLGFYWSPSPLVGGNRAGGVETAPASALYADMAPGSTVGPANTYTSAIQGTSANYRNSASHFLGVRFVNGAGTAFDYGYVKITTTAGAGNGAGFPATITGWVYDDAGGTVTIPGGTTPEPASAGLLALIAGAVGLRGRRRA
jgi:hypothetical protein